MVDLIRWLQLNNSNTISTFNWFVFAIEKENQFFHLIHCFFYYVVSTFDGCVWVFQFSRWIVRMSVCLCVLSSMKNNIICLKDKWNDQLYQTHHTTPQNIVWDFKRMGFGNPNKEPLNVTWFRFCDELLQVWWIRWICIKGRATKNTNNYSKNGEIWLQQLPNQEQKRVTSMFKI